MAKKGGNIVTGLFTAGLGAYAAKRANSVPSLLMTLVKYAAVIIGVSIGIYVLANVLRTAREGFDVPVAPSKSGDEKLVTPSGNVILY
jgi:hypothetical protein